MRRSREKSPGKRRLAVFVAIMCALVSLAWSGVRRVGATSVQPAMTIAITNDASRDIYHLYLSPVDHDVWGPDLVPEGTMIKNGQTFNITEVSCGANEIKIIAEDKQGCFVYGVVGCAGTSTGWTITDALAPDCGN